LRVERAAGFALRTVFADDCLAVLALACFAGLLDVAALASCKEAKDPTSTSAEPKAIDVKRDEKVFNPGPSY